MSGSFVRSMGTGLAVLCLLRRCHKTNVRDKAEYIGGNDIWAQRYHGIRHPQVSDGNEDLLTRKISPNVLDKQSRTADRG